MKMQYLSRLIVIIIIVAGFSIANCANPEPGNPDAKRDKVEKASEISDFTLKDYNGVEYSLSDFNDSTAIAVMFIATQCPVSNAYNERMVELYNDYHPRGIAFVGINSNKQEDVEEIKEHSKKNEFQFPVLKDWNNVVADQFGAGVTPEIYVLNSNFEELYHGRIDDSQREGNVKSQDLRAALEEILAGRSVTNAETKAFGCTIKRVSK